LVPELLREIAVAGLGFGGFHMFACSQNLRRAALVEAERRRYPQAPEWQDRRPAPAPRPTLAGGLGMPRPAGRAAPGRGTGGAHPVIELGRYLVGEAGLYVSRVVDRKVSRGQVFLVVDGGMHHHLAATGNFGQVIRRNYPVAINRTDLGTETASVVGPLCTPM